MKVISQFFRKDYVPPLTAFFLLVILLEVFSAFEWLPRALVPPLSDVVQTLLTLREDFARAFYETSLHAVLGLLLSTVFGVSLALTFSLSPFFRRAVLPFALFFQTVPIIAIAPLLVIYLGFGAPTVVASSLIVSFFPILANTLIGLESVDGAWLELFKMSKATSWQVLWKLKWPAAYPSMMTGLKIACGLSVIGTISGEFVAGGGLGALLDSARTQQRIDIVFGCLLLLSLLGMTLVGTLQWVHRRVQKIRPLGHNLSEV